MSQQYAMKFELEIIQKSVSGYARWIGGGK